MKPAIKSKIVAATTIQYALLSEADEPEVALFILLRAVINSIESQIRAATQTRKAKKEIREPQMSRITYVVSETNIAKAVIPAAMGCRTKANVRPWMTALEMSPVVVSRSTAAVALYPKCLEVQIKSPLPSV